jgi:type I restriction enzyme M protein
MTNKSGQERAELHRTIWAIANDLRGSVDGWDFKQYVLGMLFYRYISENLTNYINQGEMKQVISFDYAKISDTEAEQARLDMLKLKDSLFYQVNFLKMFEKKQTKMKI